MEGNFPHLHRAPIVEAVIDIRITPKGDFSEQRLIDELKAALPEYPRHETRRAQSCAFSFGKEAEEQASVKDLGFVGCKITHQTEPYIAQFNKEAFVFSRLPQYNDWDAFSAEAMRLWDIFEKIAIPEEVLRIGVRYINKIELADGPVELSNYYTIAPETIPNMNWPIVHFMHKDTYCPSDKYIVNVIQTIQPKQKKANTGLILDIDVMMNKKMFTDKEEIKKCLLEMKALKNETFFNSLKPEIIERFK